MSAEAWIAFGALIFAIFSASVGAVWVISGKMGKNREVYLSHMTTLNEAVDKEIAGFRQSVNIEHRDIRKEFNEAIAKAYLEMGEAPKALREKVNQVELFMRDTYLPIKDYERDHDRLLKTIELLGESIDRRLDKFEKKLDEQRENT